MQLMKEKQELTYLSWPVHRNSIEIGGTFSEGVWEMIWKRWYAYEDLCNSR